MATRKKRSGKGGKRQLNASTKSFVDAVADVVLERLTPKVPSREEFRELRKLLREVVRKSRSRSAGSGRSVGRPRSNRKCEMAGCDRPHVAQGLCSRHYQAKRRKAETKKSRKKKPVRRKRTSR